jgi:radical SAM superfamily enzyme YgiQ (UPF0313 family)
MISANAITIHNPIHCRLYLPTLPAASTQSSDFKKYDIVGISTDTTRHRQALQLAKRAKGSGCTVVMGGPHPGYVDEEILSTQRVDFIVHGEG